MPPSLRELRVFSGIIMMVFSRNHHGIKGIMKPFLFFSDGTGTPKNPIRLGGVRGFLGSLVV